MHMAVTTSKMIDEDYLQYTLIIVLHLSFFNLVHYIDNLMPYFL